ncbi:hypothetical protein HJC02_29315 [Rhizobium sp. NLR4a]|uniref:hypothetical protein n=1 Tax=Rhizobium sp. NLR4a TaxID=2731117 RepID=UPI001C832141|nr:hypothetical protein [Rhizobium sp. NLR4a]MBX5236327.1 hypothetical protein [Rhizobium sp. NLR4a]
MINDENEPPPNVRLDQKSGRAEYTFRGQSYPLPGTFTALGDAMKMAYEQCRSMGWRGR